MLKAINKLTDYRHTLTDDEPHLSKVTTNNSYNVFLNNSKKVDEQAKFEAAKVADLYRNYQGIRPSTKQIHFCTKFANKFLETYRFYNKVFTDASYWNQCLKAIQQGGTVTQFAKELLSPVVDKKTSSIIAIVAGVTVALWRVTEYNEAQICAKRFLDIVNKTDLEEIAYQTAIKLSYRFEAAIENLESSDDGLIKFVNFFIAAIAHQITSGQAYLKLGNLLSPVDIVLKSIFLVEVNTPLFSEKAYGGICTGKVTLKDTCNNGWTLEGLIWRSPAKVKGEDSLWVRDGRNNDRSDKYPIQKLNYKHEAQAEGFIEKPQTQKKSKKKPICDFKNGSPISYAELPSSNNSRATSDQPFIQKWLQKGHLCILPPVNANVIEIEFNNLQHAKDFVAELLQIGFVNPNMPTHAKKIEPILADPNNAAQERYIVKLRKVEWEALQPEENRTALISYENRVEVQPELLHQNHQLNQVVINNTTDNNLVNQQVNCNNETAPEIQPTTKQPNAQAESQTDSSQLITREHLRELLARERSKGREEGREAAIKDAAFWGGVTGFFLGGLAGLGGACWYGYKGATMFTCTLSGASLGAFGGQAIGGARAEDSWPSFFQKQPAVNNSSNKSCISNTPLVTLKEYTEQSEHNASLTMSLS